MKFESLRLMELIRLARDRGASDLHVGGAHAATLRIDGRLVMLDAPPVDEETLREYVTGVFAAAAGERLTQRGTADHASHTGLGAPLRIHAYRTVSGTRIAFRFLATSIPALETLGLPPIVASFALRPNGLVLFTGPTGSGKTTALAALIDRINRSLERVIVTVEDPVEYVHAPIRSLVAHTELGADVADYEEALRGFMRADPDVILVGEMRDRGTMEAALTAAETGHLVLSTLHTNDAAQTIDRIIDAFPGGGHAQVRTQLASTLVAVVSLRLVETQSGSGRIAVSEILTGTEGVRAIIRDGKTHQLRNAIATGRAAGMQTLEAHLSELVARGTIEARIARAVANRPAEIRDFGAAAS